MSWPPGPCPVRGACSSAHPLSLLSMTTLPPQDEVPLSHAALALGLSRNAAYDAVLRGELRGRQIGSRWMVQVASIDEARSKAPPLAKVPCR